jgi:hypothetical protein
MMRRARTHTHTHTHTHLLSNLKIHIVDKQRRSVRGTVLALRAVLAIG